MKTETYDDQNDNYLGVVRDGGILVADDKSFQ